MQLNQVRIKNFRSISDLTLDLTTPFKVLIGKNESGKSSIIKALALLNPDEKINVQDKREVLPDEDLTDVHYVYFIFEISQKESEKVHESLKKYFDPSINTDDLLILSNKKVSLETFITARNKVTYVVDFKSSNKYYAGIENKSALKVISTVQKLMRLKGGENSIIKIFEDAEFNSGSYEIVTSVEIDNLINLEKINLLKVSHPTVLYWSYNEENLLPSQINITTFSSNPDSCKPLKNLFQLSGVINIKEELAAAKQASPNRYRNFLGKIADDATRHFRGTWKEYKDIVFSLEPNGDYIEAGIKEKNTYTFQQRSDGFKRFITFLLMVSVNVKSEKLKNALILVDEPDVSLHPSGVRFLRDELRLISKKNTVVVATHSIFMIDGDYVEDYLIVKKENEKTSVELPNEKTISSEEVLLRALDYSVFEMLKDVSILFEGWRDKKLFQVAMSKLPAEYKHLKEAFRDIGISHTNGVKNVRNITPVIELVNKKCIIVSDSDAAAKAKQKEFANERLFGTWLRYDEIDKGTLAVTGEDFLNESLLEKATKHLLSANPILVGSPDLKAKKGIMQSLDVWLKEQKLSSGDISSYTDTFKSFLFDHFKHTDILPSYYTLLDNLAAYIEKGKS